MHPHTRAIAAAAAHAVIRRTKVAGLYDHDAARHLRIAAEARDDRVQVYDGDRSVHVRGTLPDLYDEGDKAFLTLAVDGATARGYDHASASHYEATVADDTVQLYDHGARTWYAFTVQTVESGLTA